MVEIKTYVWLHIKFITTTKYVLQNMMYISTGPRVTSSHPQVSPLSFRKKLQFFSLDPQYFSLDTDLSRVNHWQQVPPKCVGMLKGQKILKCYTSQGPTSVN